MAAMDLREHQRQEHCRNTAIMLAWFACMTLYSVYVVLHPSYALNVVNVAIVAASLCAVAVALSHMFSHGVRVWSVFLVLWFTFLALNGLNISEMQANKSIGDLYYLVFLPLLFAAALVSAERCDIPFFRKGSSAARIDFGLVDVMALLTIFAYIIFRFESMEQTGVRFLTPGFGAESPELIGADGSGSGLVSLLMWLTILLGSSARNKYVRYLSIAVAGFSCLLFLKRGVVVKVVLFYVLYYLGRKGAAAFSKKGLILFLVAAIVGSAIFALWGDARQHASGAGSDYSIGARIEARIDNDVVTWMYAYTSLNYDVLKQCYIDQVPTGKFEELLKPANRILLGGEMYEQVDDDGPDRDLNGFNAPTFLGPFVRESGFLACISVLLLALAVRAAIVFSFKTNSVGVYFLTMATASLALFSNSFTSPYIVYAIIIALGILWLDRSVELSAVGLRREHIRKVCNDE